MQIDIKGCIIPNDEAWIYDFFGVDYCCPKEVNEAIASAGGEPLEIFINSGGGDIFAGSEIYSAIRAYGGAVNIHVTGVAASAASVIACAGHSDISPTAMVMVHNVSSSANGDYHDMDKQSEVLKKANETIAAAYVAKTGMKKSKALELMDNETWLSADDAVKVGLIDGITESRNVQLVASYDSGMLPRSVINKMQSQRMADKAGADFLCRKNAAQVKLNQLKLGGIKND